MMLARDPFLFNGMAWFINMTLDGLSQRARANPLRTEDSQG